MINSTMNPLRKDGEEDFKFVKAINKEGFKTLIVSQKKGLKNVRANATMRDEREGFGSSILTHLWWSCLLVG